MRPLSSEEGPAIGADRRAPWGWGWKPEPKGPRAGFQVDKCVCIRRDRFPGALHKKLADMLEES